VLFGAESHSTKKNVARDKGVETLKEQIVAERRLLDAVIGILPSLDTLSALAKEQEMSKSSKVLSNFLTARPDLLKLKKMGVLGGSSAVNVRKNPLEKELGGIFGSRSSLGGQTTAGTPTASGGPIKALPTAKTAPASALAAAGAGAGANSKTAEEPAPATPLSAAGRPAPLTPVGTAAAAGTGHAPGTPTGPALARRNSARLSDAAAKQPPASPSKPDKAADKR
jgi:hypothetical protein